MLNPRGPDRASQTEQSAGRRNKSKRERLSKSEQKKEQENPWAGEQALPKKMVVFRSWEENRALREYGTS
jgi:hypothetical protein